MVNCLLAFLDFDPLRADERLDGANSPGKVGTDLPNSGQFRHDI
jgi:hypothetical protein